jgi:peroxiredoxin
VQSAREGKKWSEKKVIEAQAEYKAAIDLSPKDGSFHLRMALALFKQMHDAEGRAEVDRYLELSPNGQNVEFAKQLRVNPRRGREDFAPDFMVTTLKGETLHLSNLAGRFVVLDFWATWCPPCRDSVGELRDLSKKYPSDRVVILSISGDSEEGKWCEFVDAKKMDWLQYRDADRRIGKLFEVHGIPCYVIIDPDGFIRERIIGRNPQESIVHRLKETLNTAMSEPPSRALQ